MALSEIIAAKRRFVANQKKERPSLYFMYSVSLKTLSINNTASAPKSLAA